MIILFFIGIVFVIFPVLILCSTFKIDIKELEIINEKIKKFRIIFSLVLFNKLTWVKLKVDNKRLNKINEKVKKQLFNKILNSKILTKYKEINILKEWQEISKKMHLEGLNFILKIGTENACITANIVGIISIILSILFFGKRHKIKYLIEPIYSDKNSLYLSLNCIFTIKLIHIIIRKKHLKEKEVYQINGRKSNFKPYAGING